MDPSSTNPTIPQFKRRPRSPSWVAKQQRQHHAMERLAEHIDAPLSTLPFLMNRALGFTELDGLNRRLEPPIQMSAQIVVCCGSGGVGKTSTSALGLALASRTTRRPVDHRPRRQLADNPNLGAIGGTPTSPLQGGSERDALMLDVEEPSRR